MSDPLSIAGSIAGIVQLSASVFQQVSKFVKDAKGAEKAVKDLADQTRNLSGVLQNLALLASSLDQESSASAFKAQHLHTCRETLLAVKKKKKKKNDWKSHCWDSMKEVHVRRFVAASNGLTPQMTPTGCLRKLKATETLSL